MNKREAREILFTLVFEYEFHPDRDAEEIYETARAERGFENYRYIKRGLTDIIRHRDDIASIIAARAEGWNISRITPVTRSILFVGVYDMIYKTTSPSIAINEAVELAKKYAEDEASPFVNGILNKIGANALEIKESLAAVSAESSDTLDNTSPAEDMAADTDE